MPQPKNLEVPPAVGAMVDVAIFGHGKITFQTVVRNVYGFDPVRKLWSVNVPFSLEQKLRGMAHEDYLDSPKNQAVWIERHVNGWRVAEDQSDG